MRWLSELQRKMDEVPAKYLILDGSINPGERIIGKLPEDLLRLYGVHLQMVDEIRSTLQEHILCHHHNRATESGCSAFHEKLRWLLRQDETVITFFWTAVRSEFNILEESVGIRAHGAVVAYDASAEQENDDAIMKAMLQQMKCEGKPN